VLLRLASKLLWPVLLVAAAGLSAFLTMVRVRQEVPFALVFPGANSRETYFSMHRIRDAQSLCKGRGVKVGILDHLFGTERHPGLYAGGNNFLDESERWKLTDKDEHGYWMAIVLREVAPEVQIYALNTSSRDEKTRVEAMAKAIDWAIENRIDVLTYSNRPFSPEGRARLDPAVRKAHAADIVTTFIHYGEPGNLLPGGLFPDLEDGREPDVHVLHYDYGVVFVRDYARFQQGQEVRGYRPFLSLSSTSPVIAGVVALMRGLKPELSPAQCQEILRTTARPLEFEGKNVPRCLDAAAAVRHVEALPSQSDT
jgi:hypothetical protein